MCTVTFIPLDNKVFITHNRDEKRSRTAAIAPASYTVNGYTLLFPRDTAAGGSWIGINTTGAAAVLLNGAFVKHRQQPPYRKSRGRIFLDILASNDLLDAFQTIDLVCIEPFTLILWTYNNLYECRWDGHEKTVAAPDATTPHTWSSVTLYDAEIIAKRETWFSSWLREHARPSLKDIVQFHLSAGDGDARNDLRMNRNGQILTVSITAMEIAAATATMQYTCLQENSCSTQSLNFTKAAFFS